MQAFRADWREPSEYPPKECSDRLRLAWEFLRRNARYAKHVEQMQQLAEGEFENTIKSRSASVLDGLECWPPAEIGETAATYHKRVTDKTKGKRGRIDIAQNTFINRWALEYPVRPDQEYDPDVIQFKPPIVALKRHSKLVTRNFHLFLYPNEIALRFRLDLRLNQQLDGLEKRFKAEVKKYRASLGEMGQQVTQSGQTLVSLDTLREKEVLSHAHYWLRAYDALTQPKVLLGDENRRTAHESGEAEVRTFLSKEAKKVGASETAFQRGRVDGWKNSADDYINGMKFLTLLMGVKPLNSEKETVTQAALRNLGKSGPV